jgi:hypothetical protein
MPLVTEEMVTEALSKMAPFKALGIDGICTLGFPLG